MAGTLRGSLGLKSGPLAPTSAKLTTQYLVLDHMNNHYKKISKAKPAIDNRPPKSIASSQKTRERKDREYYLKHGTSRPTSRMSGRPLSHNEFIDEDYYDETNWEDPEDEDERLVYSIMRTTLKEKPGGSADATYGGSSYQRGHSPNNFNKTIKYQDRDQANALQTYYKHEKRPSSGRSTMSAASRTSLGGTQKKGTYDGDLLDKRSHVFTEPEKPFTPRTLKSNRQSRLTEYKYYTAPPQKRGQSQDFEEKTQNTHEFRPKPKPRGTTPLERTSTQTLTESQLMFESLQSRDLRHLKADKDVVPKLDISMDKDHMHWLKEQADKAQLRAKSGRKTPLDQIEEKEPILVNGGTAPPRDDTMRGSGRQTKSFATKSLTRHKLTEAEEEQKYVAFVKQVTEEVLNTGICTDRILKKVFARHVEKNKHVLKISRMRALLDKLRMDLGVTPEVLLSDDESDEVKAMRYMHADPDVKAARIAMQQQQTQPISDSTLNSTNTLNMDSTGEAFSTYRSQVRRDSQASEKVGTRSNAIEHELQPQVQDRKSLASDSRSSIAQRSLANSSRSDVHQTSEVSRPSTGVRSEGEKSFVSSEMSRPNTGVGSEGGKSFTSESRSTVIERGSTLEATDLDETSVFGTTTGTGFGVTEDLSATQALERYQMTITAKDNQGASQSTSEVDGSEHTLTRDESGLGVMSPSEAESSVLSSPAHTLKPAVRPRRRRVSQEDQKQHLPDLRRTPRDHVSPRPETNKKVSAEDGSETSKKIQEKDRLLRKDDTEKQEIEEMIDDYEDDYEDDYDADDDDGQGEGTHRTSDEDF